MKPAAPCTASVLWKPVAPATSSPPSRSASPESFIPAEPEMSLVTASVLDSVAAPVTAAVPPTARLLPMLAAMLVSIPLAADVSKRT